MCFFILQHTCSLEEKLWQTSGGVCVCVCVKSLSRVRLFATPWTVAHQTPLSIGFSRQEYWSGLPFPSPGDLPNPGIEARSPALQADALSSEPPGKPRQHIKNQRHYFTNKGPSSQSYGFSSSHVWMWELNYKESWVPKNWCFYCGVGEGSWESLGLQGDQTSPS